MNRSCIRCGIATHGDICRDCASVLRMGAAGRCGTNDGMNDHNRNGTKPCADCKAAYAAYMRILRRRTDLGMPVRSRRAEVPGWKTRRPDLSDMAQVGPVLDAGLRASA